MRPRLLSAALLLTGAGLVALAASHGGSRGAGAATDNTFRISMTPIAFDYVDPALSFGNALIEVSCARLLYYPDKHGSAGYTITPEVATAFPRVSNGGKTFTFTLRDTYRFSDGSPVRASAFARAIDRALIAGRTIPDAALYTLDIVGGQEVIDGKAEHASGVTASGNRLVVRLTAPAPNFLPRLTTTLFCAVPPSLPVDPEGVGAFPGSGPYSISEYVPGKRAVVERNRYYRGSRPHNVERFVVDIVADPAKVLDRIERGEADWGAAPPTYYYDPARDLQRKYGTGKSPRYFVVPGLVSGGYAVNVARPLFRNNLALRRAVNFAVDRPRITAPFRGRPTDQYLPSSLPGFKDVPLYPLRGPDLRTAKALARGNTRGGKAVLWVPDIPEFRTAGQVLRQNLRKIGLQVVMTAIPPASYYPRLNKSGAAFDLAAVAWIGAFPDASDYTNSLFDSRFIGRSNIGRFRSTKYDQMMRHAATLSGSARYSAYGELDVQLARDAAPRVAIAFEGVPTLVSKRVGCILLRPGLNLAAACLK